MKFVYEKQDIDSRQRAEETCWLLANGLGGFASTSAAFSVTRNDQGLLIAAKTPNQRFNLVHRLSETLAVGEKTVFLSTQTFGDGAPPEDGWRYLASFVWEDGPCWLYEVGGVRVTRKCAMEYGVNTSAVVYTVENRSETVAEDWLESTSLPVIQVDGTKPVAYNVEEIMRQGGRA